MAFFSHFFSRKMSSDILLEEVNATVKDLVGGKKFMTAKLSGEKTTKDELQALIVKEKVRLASLRRQQDLAIKLANELPERIEKIEKTSTELRDSVSSLSRQEEAQKAAVAKIKAKQAELEQTVAKIAKLITESREEDAIRKFQKDNLWYLIGRVVEARKAMAAGSRPPTASWKEEADFDHLSARIEHNDKLIREIESLLH